MFCQHNVNEEKEPVSSRVAQWKRANAQNSTQRSEDQNLALE